MFISSVSVMRPYEYCELLGYYYQLSGCFAMSSCGNCKRNTHCGDLML